jgi:hypothetical protein
VQLLCSHSRTLGRERRHRRVAGDPERAETLRTERNLLRCYQSAVDPTDPADFGRLSVVNGQCQWNQESPEQADLFSRLNSFDMLGITAVFVKGIQTLTGALNGCAGHANWRAGVMVGSACTPWTLAHEVGHVLLGSTYSPVHTSSPLNIMYEKSSQFTQTSNPSLDLSQVGQMLRSQYVRPC